METSSRDPKSYQVFASCNQVIAESDRIEPSSEDYQERMFTPPSTMKDSSEKQSSNGQASSESTSKSLEEQDKLDKLLDKREEVKRLIANRDRDIAQIKTNIEKASNLEEINEGLSTNESAIKYLKIAIKNKNSEISTLEAVIKNKIHMEDILKMKILQLQAKATKEKIDLLQSKGSYISIGGNSNLSSFPHIEYTETKQCKCSIF